ncbi:eukaryotic translation initiation factor eIF-4G [Klebsormidium nitens]|uniref:Eukaryotic translation initiation factor eIF-4G n=1 Tax=Klebsormidium nitens TaxID=105231 RepID=A0A1Y1IEH9_KLENI|nr:eukaryotic translation initiation factor eIF-4G [Klebsormidium nitens]|eukprot:GAQ88382.1 eukaryotic translation initiation factor eIF-4G [Klebsormidium nitens]
MMDKSTPVDNHSEANPATSSGDAPGNPEANQSVNHGASNVSLRPGGGSSVSLRPGGGVSLRPWGGVSLRPGGPSLSAGAVRQAAPSKAQQVDDLGPSPAEQRAPGSTDRHRYNQSELLKLKEVSKGIPKELLSAGLALLRADGQSQADGNWNTRRDLGPAPPTAPVADDRDWKARTPLPPPPPEQAEQNGVAPRPATPQDKRGPKQGGKGGKGANGEGRVETRQPIEAPRPQPQAAGPAPGIVKTANPWKAGGVQDPSEKLYKTVKGVLNKLTPDNYEKLFNQIVSAGISNADMLRGVISLIFDKAVLEPTFCPLYAELCVKLSKALPEFNEGEDKPVTFRRVMLNTCQEEFEAAESLRDEVKRMTKTEEAAERADKELTVKRRTMGNIKLIGELYKQKMIPEKIVHACLQQLLGDPKAEPVEENTEALVHLLTTVGKQLEMKPNSKKFVGEYFESLKTLQTNRKLQTRIRFLVRDLIERRANNWVPRREELKVTTTSNKSLEAQFGLIPPKGMRDGPLFPEGPSRGPVVPPVPVEDGWEVVGLSGKRAPRLANLPGAPPAIPPVSTGPPTLLPGMGPQRIPPPQQFAGKSSALIGSGPGARPNPPPARKEPTPEPKPAPVSAPISEKPAAKKEKPLSDEEKEEQLVKKTDSFLKEYLSAADIKEAALCVTELKTPSYHSTIVQTAVNLGFEGKDRDRELVGKLLPGLVAQKAITAEELEAGFMALAEQLDDLAIDLPKAPRYLGDFVGKAIAAGAMNLSSIKTASEKAEDVRARRHFAAAALQAFKKDKGEGALFKAGKELDLKSFLTDDMEGPLDEFLKQENLSILA